MSTDHPLEDEVTQLARRVLKARGRLAYQFDPALTQALSEEELRAERELAERIRVQDREQRWKQAQAAASASDRARHTTEQIEKADIRDLLLARRAIAAQRRESSPHAKLASLYRHRSWSLRALAGVVVAGMLWSAVNVQHNIAPGGPGDPLYWFSYLLEGMISVCLIIIMTGTNKVAEWGVIDNRKQVAAAEVALLALTVTLNIYPYLRGGVWYDAAVHAVAPVMIGVSLLIHDAASMRYGLAIVAATEQIRDLPDPAEQIRRTWPAIGGYRLMGVPSDVVPGAPADPVALAEQIEDLPVVPEAVASVPSDGDAATVTMPVVVDNGVAPARSNGKAAISNGQNHDARTDVESRAVVAETSVHGAGDESRTAAELHNSGSFATTIDWQTSTVGSDNGGAASTAAYSEDSALAAFNDLDDYAAKVDKALQSVYDDENTDTAQFRLSEALEQELAELQAQRRQARTSRQR